MSETTATGKTGSPSPGVTADWRLTAEFVDACIQRAGRSFQEGELAYLAMTSQVENSIRDRVAYEMHLQLRQSRLDVGREWTGLFAEGREGQPTPRKVDLAVVERPRRRLSCTPAPHGVVEFKAFYAHDVRSRGGQNKVYRAVYKDVEKCVDWSSFIMGEVFSVVLLPSLQLIGARHPYQIMGKEFERKIMLDKFLREASRCSDKATVQELSSLLSQLGPVRDGLIDAGTDSGVRATVPYVILGSVSTETYENLPRYRLPRQAAG